MSIFDYATAREVKSVPTTEHYAALVNTSFSYGDGYGERGMSSISRHESLDYVILPTVTDVQAWVKEQHARTDKKTYRIIHVNPVTVTTTVQVEVLS
jgi:hypothetical protein